MRRDFDPTHDASEADRVFRRVDPPFSAYAQIVDFLKTMWPHVLGIAAVTVVLVQIAPKT